MSDARRAVLALIEHPALVAAVRRLPAPALHKLVTHLGLEDAGALIALATRAQLTQVLDQDVWSNPRPGEAERFDPARFGTWLEVMLELGAEFAAARVAEMDPDLVTAALLHHVLVIDDAARALEAFSSDRGPSDDERLEDKLLEGTLSFEIGGYLLVAKRHDAWDAILQVLTELDAQHGDFAARLLDRAAAITAAEVEESGGLHHVLSSAEQLEEDLAAAREDRRARAGHVEPRAAKAFLRLAAETPRDTRKALARDPQTLAYFREFESASPFDEETPSPEAERSPATRAQPAGAPTSRGAQNAALARTAPSLDALPLNALPLDALTAWLREADEDETPARKRLDAIATQDPTTQDPSRWPISRAIDAEPDAARRAALLGELAYVANVLLAACTLGGERLRPNEAGEAALALANLGLMHARGDGKAPDRAAPLGDLDVVTVFRLGWRLAREEVGLYAAGRLLAWAKAKPFLAGEIRHLEEAIAQKEPARARRRLEALFSHLGKAAYERLAAALDEIPRADTFISTPAEITRAQAHIAQALEPRKM